MIVALLVFHVPVRVFGPSPVRADNASNRTGPPSADGRTKRRRSPPIGNLRATARAAGSRGCCKNRCRRQLVACQQCSLPHQILSMIIFGRFSSIAMFSSFCINFSGMHTLAAVNQVAQKNSILRCYPVEKYGQTQKIQRPRAMITILFRNVAMICQTAVNVQADS